MTTKKIPQKPRGRKRASKASTDGPRLFQITGADVELLKLDGVVMTRLILESVDNKTPEQRDHLLFLALQLCKQVQDVAVNAKQVAQ